MKFLKVIGIAILVFFWIGVIRACLNSDKENETAASTHPDTSRSVPEVDTAGIIEGLDKVIKRLPTEKFPKNQISDIVAEMVYFQIIGRQINMAETSIGNKGKKKTEKLRKVLVALQLKEFPEMRQYYATIMSNKMWKDNMTVGYGGKRYATIYLSAAIFASNKNIAETQATLQSMLELLRFKQSQYRWYKDAEEYQYYTIKSLKDSEITIAE